MGDSEFRLRLIRPTQGLDEGDSQGCLSMCEARVVHGKPGSSETPCAGVLAVKLDQEFLSDKHAHPEGRSLVLEGRRPWLGSDVGKCFRRVVIGGSPGAPRDI